MDNRTCVRYNQRVGKRVYDWAAIQRYHDDGHGYRECHARFGMAHATWKSAIKRGLLIPRGRCVPREGNDAQRRYDWAEIQSYYDLGHTYRECRAKFGFCAATWHKATKRGEITTRARSLPVAVLLATSKSRAAVRRRLLSEGILENVCQGCGLTEWCGRPISMHIDHINGKRHDHRLENLRMLCPNCHSQTPTYGGRNVRRRRQLQDPSSAV